MAELGNYFSHNLTNRANIMRRDNVNIKVLKFCLHGFNKKLVDPFFLYKIATKLLRSNATFSQISATLLEGESSLYAIIIS